MNNSIMRIALSKKGLTLIEAIISIAVFAIFALLVNSIFFNILRGSIKQESLKEIKQSGDFTITTMSNRIRQAKELLSTCDPANPTNSITILNQDDTQTRFEGFIDTDTIRIVATDPVAGTHENISSSLVTLPDVTNLVFTCDDASGSALVGIYFFLDHRNNEIQEERSETHASMEFQTTVYIREKYYQ